MVEMADIVRRHGPAYRHKFAARMLPSHRRALQDIEHCRTPALGGTTYRCDHCGQFDYSYHSCGNRACPKCGNDKVTEWIAQQEALLLPIPHFFITFTLPASARGPARSNQKVVYGILMKTAWEALRKLARDPKFLGADIGALAILQTWKRDMGFHPHVHFLVPAGGLCVDQQRWVATRSSEYLVAEKPLAIIFKAKFRDALKKAGLYNQFPAATWQPDWVVDCEFVGDGRGVVKYLAPYVYRTAISNNRILALSEDGQVTYCYKANAGTRHTVTLSAERFLARFLQHVLPAGFQRIRYYGFLHPNGRDRLNLIRALFAFGPYHKPQNTPAPAAPRACPHCGGTLTLLAPLKRRPP
jgi:hypothetical protein